MPDRRPRMSLRNAIAVASLVFSAAGCGTAPAGSPAPGSPSAGAAASTSAQAAVLWPAPPDPMERAVQAGLKPGPKEYMTNHVHAHLDVFVDGKPITVPAGIGIKIDDPHVRRFDEPDGIAYGGIDLCNVPCISPLHTHDATGIIHTESSESGSTTLGQLFTEWGVALDASCVATFCGPTTKIAIYIDGELSAGDPRTIELTDQREIAIVIGTPPAQIPRTADFSKA
jgi:hypothetical protein